MLIKHFWSTFALSIVLASLTQFAAKADHNWNRWRGPDGNGLSGETNLPVKWSAEDVTWRAELKGLGHSSPTIWGERIFLTAAIEGGKQRVVMCIDRNNGKIVWKRTAWEGVPEQSHRMNQWASPTCATDGERVVAFLGNGGVHCYDLDGKEMWSREVGRFQGSWGAAASPVIIGDLVIQNCDDTGKAFLLGLEKQTGKEVWRTARREKPRGGWSSPILIDADERQELVLNGEFGVQAYDPTSGKEHWVLQEF